MSLKDDINAMQKEMLSNIPEDVLKVMMSATENLVKGGLAEKALNVGAKAPSFTLPNTKGEKISLDELLKNGPVVINFYRGAWCPYCNLELKALQDSIGRIKQEGATLVSISPNLREVSAGFIEKNPFDFDILSDEGNAVAREYGLVFTMAEELRPIYDSFGLNIPEHDGNDSFELPIPATYIIGTDGVIAYAHINADYTTRMEPAKIVEQLAKLEKERK